MAKWFILSLLTLLLWGFWGFVSKVALSYMGPRSLFLYGSVGAILVSITAAAFFGYRFEAHRVGAPLGILAGFFGAAGALFLYAALKEGKASIVVTMTALYPLVTILLSFLILREEITIKQTLGMLFAILAMLLFSL